MSTDQISPDQLSSLSGRKWLSYPKISLEKKPLFKAKVFSYNILSPGLVKREMFPYCGKETLPWKYRKVRLLHEIRSYQPDILCIQEVDEGWWKKELSVIMKTNFIDPAQERQRINRERKKTKQTEESLNIEMNLSPSYDGVFQRKDGSGTHGVCILWNTSMFKMVHQSPVHFDDIAESFQNLQEKSEMTYGNVALFVVLEKVSNVDSSQEILNSNHSKEETTTKTTTEENINGVIVGTTHLHWNFSHGFTQLMQLNSFFTHSHELSIRYPKMVPINCADYNFSPDSHLYHFATHRRIPPLLFPYFSLPSDSHTPYDISRVPPSPDPKLTPTPSSLLSLSPSISTCSCSLCEVFSFRNLKMPQLQVDMTQNTSESGSLTSLVKNHLSNVNHINSYVRPFQVAQTYLNACDKLPLYYSVYSCYEHISENIFEPNSDNSTDDRRKQRKQYRHKNDFEPEYTLVGIWLGVLDYIFIPKNRILNRYKNKEIENKEQEIEISSGLNVEIERIIEFPDFEKVNSEFGLPNKTYPSDHLFLMCELSFFENNE